MFRIDKSSVGYLKNPPYVVSPRNDIKENFEESPQDAANAESPVIAAEKKAGRLIADAEARASGIMAAAEADAKSIRERALKEGRRLGLEQATADINKTREKESAEFMRVLAELAAIRADLVDNSEKQLVSLAVDIAEKIIRLELDRNDEAFFSIAKNALMQMKGSGKIILRVSSDEYKRLFNKDTAAFKLIDEVIHVAVAADADLTLGSCLFESDDETINAGVDLQLQSVRNAFFTTEGQD